MNCLLTRVPSRPWTGEEPGLTFPRGSAPLARAGRSDQGHTEQTRFIRSRPTSAHCPPGPLAPPPGRKTSPYEFTPRSGPVCLNPARLPGLGTTGQQRGEMPVGSGHLGGGCWVVGQVGRPGLARERVGPRHWLDPGRDVSSNAYPPPRNG